MITEEATNFKIIIDGNLTKIPYGVKAIKLDSTYFIWIWHGNYIDIIEQPTLSITEAYTPGVDSNVIQPHFNEIRLKGTIVDIFLVGDDSLYALDSLGFLYSFSHFENKPSSPILSTEVDLFSTSETNDVSSKWKENEVTRVINCDQVLSVCQLNSGIAVLTVEEEHLAIQIYSLPELNFKSIVHLEKYSYESAVLTSCNINLLSPSLKKQFQDKIEILDTEIVVIGLSSGMVLWCSVTSSSIIKGPFFLSLLLHKVQNAYWINDPESVLITNLLIVLSSGPVIIYGSQTENDNEPTTLYLPDSVKTSWISGTFFLSSNFIDCYISQLKFGEKITMSSSSIPIKGITAMTKSPDSDNLIVTTLHSVYIFGPHGMSFDHSSPQFVIPEQSLLDNLLIQTQLLDDVYKQMHKEDEVLKAISTSIIAQNIPCLFTVTVKATSDYEFIVTINLTQADISFSHELWNVNTEICSVDGHKKSILTRTKEDLNSEHDIQIVAFDELTIGSTVVIELVSFLESGQPVLIVPVGKVEVDACHLMASKNVTLKNEQTLGNILRSWKSEPTKEINHECRLIFKIPDVIPLASSLKIILQDSQERIMLEDWNKITEFKKHNVHISIQNTPVLLQLNLESKELAITSFDVQICHKVKEAVNKRFNMNAQNKRISEELSLEIQAAYQSLEIEILKDDEEFLIIQEIKNKLRTNISSKIDSF